MKAADTANPFAVMLTARHVVAHLGPGLVYLSPDPPTENSFVKIWEEGLYELSDKPFGAGKWATTADIAANHGHMNVRIPAGLKAGL